VKIKKTLVISLISIIIIFLLLAFNYSQKYSIPDNKNQLEKSIGKSTDVLANTIDIKQSINIDDKKFVLFTMGKNIGSAEFAYGLNNKYKIGLVTYGTSIVTYRIIKTRKAKYFVIEGINHNSAVKYLRLPLDNKEYILNIPNQEYFISYCSVPESTKIEYPDINTLKFYDYSDKDVTASFISNNLYQQNITE
jgi:hypothetical protein